MSRFMIAVVGENGEVFIGTMYTAQYMYKSLRWLVRYGKCKNFTVYICRLSSNKCFYEYEIDMFDCCYTNYPSFSVITENGVEEMTENFRKRICGI